MPRSAWCSIVVSAARTVASGDDLPEDLIRRVERQITDVLDIDGCRYERGAGHQHAELHSDGTATAIRRPSLEQSLVAVILAEQAGAALAAGVGREREPPHTDR